MIKKWAFNHSVIADEHVRNVVRCIRLHEAHMSWITSTDNALSEATCLRETYYRMLRISWEHRRVVRRLSVAEPYDVQERELESARSNR
jgi:hypothetical protein